MKNIVVTVLIMSVLAGCTSPLLGPNATYDRISGEVKNATSQRKEPVERPAAVDQALLPPLAVEPPKPTPAPEPRFDLVVTNAPAAQVFMAIVSGTRYSMLVHPDVSGTLSVNLKNVTVKEALDTIRDLYGYEYKTQGTRIMMQPNTLQTRIFQVNYLAGKRQGLTDVRVTSGSISSAQSSNTNTSSSNSSSTDGNTSSSTNRTQESSRVETTSQNDFWGELSNALKAIVGSEEGRQVIINPLSGVIAVRGFPADIRNVETYLHATQLVIERQVMLEAKIIEVELSDGFETGINWSAFRSKGSRTSVGVGGPGTVLQNTGTLATGATDIDYTTRTFAEPLLSAGVGTDLVVDSVATGSIFGLAFQTKHFAALLKFLETQGNVQVLSSPRIATLNNQKAVLKVGTDEFFVTSVTTSTTTSGTSTVSSPTISVQPFFSGIALDVMPQIDENDNIILHLHPSVSVVAEKQKNVDLGTLGSFKLPLASSSINETDSIVRVQDGNIVAIGGLMKQQQSYDASGLPGMSDIPVVGHLFGQKSRSGLKRELVILLKPTVIRGDHAWQEDLNGVQQRLESFDPRRAVQRSQ